MSESDQHPAEGAVQQNYVWLTLGFFMPLFALYGAYAVFNARAATADSWLQSHTDYQLRLLSVSAGLLVVGIVLGLLHWGFLGLLLFGAFWVWYVWRVAKGWLALGQGKAAAAGWV